MITGGCSGKVRTSANLAELGPPVVAERGDGSGSLAIGRFPGIRASFTVDAAPGRRMWMVGESTRPVLWEVANARHVRDLVVKAQQTATRRRPPGATGTPTENVASG